MKQLDVVVSPPPFLRNPYLTKDMNFFLVNYYLVTFGIVTDRWTDRQTDRRTDRKRRIRAHRALAQVGSKMCLCGTCLTSLPQTHTSSSVGGRSCVSAPRRRRADPAVLVVWAVAVHAGYEGNDNSQLGRSSSFMNWSNSIHCYFLVNVSQTRLYINCSRNTCSDCVVQKLQCQKTVAKTPVLLQLL